MKLQLKEIITEYQTSSPINKFPDFELPFVLHTDVSGQGLECSLYKIQKGAARVIGYGSHTLVGAEQKYHSSRQDLLALKWVFCDHFKEYLYYAKLCDVYADNNPLILLLRMSWSEIGK